MKGIMRKLLTLAILAVVICLSFNVFAATVEEEAQALIDAGLVKDENFALALAESGVTVENYKTFDDQVKASGHNIKSIEGISNFLNVSKFDLSNNYINDITPIMIPEGVHYAGFFDLTDNPVNLYFPCIQEKEYVYSSTDGNAGSVVTDQRFGTDINFLDDGSKHTVRVYFGASVGGKYYWNRLDGNTTYPHLTGTASGVSLNYNSDAAPDSTEASYADLVFDKNATATLRAYFDNYRFYTGWKDNSDTAQQNATQQSQSPSFYYTIGAKYYSPVSVDVSSTVLGGFIIEKTDSNRTPLAGATFGVYSSEDCNADSLVVEGTTGEDGKVVFSGLKAGKYYFKEIKAPAGYVLDDSITPVNVTVDITTGSSVKGGESEFNYVTGDVIEVEPDWDAWELKQKPYHPMVIKSGEVKTATPSDKTVYITNGGEKITEIVAGVASSDSSKVTETSAKLTLTVNGEAENIGSSNEALEKINGMIEAGTVSGSIVLEGSVEYQLNSDNFVTYTITDKSLCVFIQPIADKKLVGRAIKANEFGFEILKLQTAEDGSEEEVLVFSGVNAAANADEDTTVVNFFDADGNAAVMRFCSAGEHNFVLREVIPDSKEEGMVYDETDHVIVVTVTESGEKGLKAEVKVDGEAVGTYYSAETTDENNEPSNMGTANLCTIVNRFTERENPKTGVPTLFSLVDLLTVAGLGIVLKKRFF